MFGTKKLLHVDSHVAFRESLAKVLDQSGTMRVVAEADNATEARKLRETVDVVLIGLPITDDPELAFIRELLSHRPDCSVVVIVDSIGNDESCLALECGVRSILPRKVHLDELVFHLGTADRNVSTIDRETSLKMLARALEVKTFDFQRLQYQSRLTTREIQILRELTDGRSDREIADRLAISVDTVRTHFVHILEKLNVRTRVQALVLAMRYGIHAE